MSPVSDGLRDVQNLSPLERARMVLADRLRDRFDGCTIAPEGTQARRGEKLVTPAAVIVVVHELRDEWLRDGLPS